VPAFPLGAGTRDVLPVAGLFPWQAVKDLASTVRPGAPAADRSAAGARLPPQDSVTPGEAVSQGTRSLGIPRGCVPETVRQRPLDIPESSLSGSQTLLGSGSMGGVSLPLRWPPPPPSPPAPPSFPPPPPPSPRPPPSPPPPPPPFLPPTLAPPGPPAPPARPRLAAPSNSPPRTPPTLASHSPSNPSPASRLPSTGLSRRGSTGSFDEYCPGRDAGSQVGGGFRAQGQGPGGSLKHGLHAPGERGRGDGRGRGRGRGRGSVRGSGRRKRRRRRRRRRSVATLGRRPEERGFGAGLVLPHSQVRTRPPQSQRGLRRRVVRPGGAPAMCRGICCGSSSPCAWGTRDRSDRGLRSAAPLGGPQDAPAAGLRQLRPVHAIPGCTAGGGHRGGPQRGAGTPRESQRGISQQW